jgi:DNA-binding LytR/AlgR family response regulator
MDAYSGGAHSAPMPSVTPAADHLLARRSLRELGFGFIYWLGVVLVLEPGNLLHGAPPDAAAWGHEILRLAGAGLLGGLATPFLLALTRRLPIEGPQAGRRAAIHLAFCSAAAVVLVIASCLLATLLPGAARYPLEARIADELVANALLVTACLAGLTVLAHAARAIGRANPLGHAREVTITQRGHIARMDLAAVAWIETQGNYLALHGREGTKLLRRTAKSFEAELDPARFVRIHRRIIVALDAVQSVAPRDAGDATVRLANGEELRVSRNYRTQLWKALEASAQRLSTAT